MIRRMRALTVAILCLAALCPALVAETKPNILFILTEDQGARLSHLGPPGLQTPNMAALPISNCIVPAKIGDR